MHLLRRIELYLKTSAVPPTRFGRDSVRDPRLVLDMRNGREPRPATAARIHAFLDRAEQEAGR